MAVLCLAACSDGNSTASPANAAVPVVLTIGFPYSTGQDPLHGVGQAARLASLEGLSTQEISGRPIPRLAEGWSESADGLAWTIRLRPSAVFHDGSPVDAAAVKNSLDQFLASNASSFSPGLRDITSIEAESEFVLTIRLRRRSSLLLDDLDSPITKVDKAGSVIGTGPYVVTTSSSDEVRMAAFARYYRGTPVITQLIWRVYPTVRTAWAATMRGEVDFLYEVGPETREFLQAEASVQLYSLLRNYVYALVFNSKSPIFRSPEVRKALNYAVNRQTIVDRAFRGFALVASGPSWPLHWAYDPSAPVFTYDPKRAAASLNKALPPRETASSAQLPRLKFACLIPENFQLWERLALMVQRDLAEVGVDMVVEAVPFDRFNEKIASGDFDTVLMEMISGFSVSRPFFFWHSSGSSNFSGYHSSSTDRALEGILRASSEGEYRDRFHQFQDAMFDDPPAIFLAWSQTARAVSRRFEVVRAPGGDIRMTIGDWRLAGNAAQVGN